MSDADSDNIRSVGDRKLVYSPVLNFIRTNFESGVKDEVIIKYAVDFLVKPVGDKMIVSIDKTAALGFCVPAADATRFGNSNSVKLCFTDARSLDHALKDGIRIEYAAIQVSVFHDIPRCCIECCSPNHLQAVCESSFPKCSRCDGPHEPVHDSPCQMQPKCANCDGCHILYSLRCPILCHIVNSRKKTPNNK